MMKVILERLLVVEHGGGSILGIILCMVPFFAQTAFADLEIDSGATLEIDSGATLEIDNGNLDVNGALDTAGFTLESNITLRGTGTVNGDVEVKGIVSPGNGGVGTLHFGSNVNFQSGSIFNCYAASDTMIDRLSVTGVVSGICQVNMSQAGGAVPFVEPIIDGAAASSFGSFSLGGGSPQNWQLLDFGSTLAVSEIVSDSDSDEMTDAWELQYGLDPDDDQDATLDGDFDGMDNRFEFLAGTDPTDENSVFAFNSMEIDNSTLVYQLCVDTIPDRVYSLEHTTTFPTGWAEDVVTQIAGDGSEKCLTRDFTAELDGEQTVFLRVRITKP